MKLQAVEVCTAVQSRSIFFVVVIQPLRVAVEASKDDGSTRNYLDMVRLSRSAYVLPTSRMHVSMLLPT